MRHMHLRAPNWECRNGIPLSAWKERFEHSVPAGEWGCSCPLKSFSNGSRAPGGSRDLQNSHLWLLPCFQPFITSSGLTFCPVPSCSRRGQVRFAADSFQPSPESWPLALGPHAAWTQRGPALCPRVWETQSQSCSFSHSHRAHNLTPSTRIISHKPADKPQGKYRYYPHCNRKKIVGG